jgi:hypothetical protein
MNKISFQNLQMMINAKTQIINDRDEANEKNKPEPEERHELSMEDLKKIPDIKFI